MTAANARDLRIVDNTAAHRFEARVNGEFAELIYERDATHLVVIHTGVPDSLEGHGVGGALVAAAIDDTAAARGLIVVPRCPFARRWLEDHPDAAQRVQIEWPERRS